MSIASRVRNAVSRVFRGPQTRATVTTTSAQRISGPGGGPVTSESTRAGTNVSSGGVTSEPKPARSSSGRSSSTGSSPFPNQSSTGVETVIPQPSTTGRVVDLANNAAGSASASALNQGGGPASPQDSAGASLQPIEQFTPLQRPYEPAESMSGFQKAGSVFRSYFSSTNLYRDVAEQALGAGSYQAPNPVKALGTLISPFQVFAPGKRGDVAVDIAYRGTGEYNPSSGRYENPTRMSNVTGFGRAQELAITNPEIALPTEVVAKRVRDEAIAEVRPIYETRATQIGTSYQNRINAGELTVDQAKSLYAADIAMLQTQYQSAATDRYAEKASDRVSKAAGFSSEYNRLSRYSFNVPAVGSTAILLGGGLIGGSSIPVARAVGAAVNAAVAIEGQTNVYEGIANKNLVQIGLGAAAFALGTYGLARYAANEVTLAQIEGVAQKAPRQLLGTRSELRENSFQDIYGYEQRTPSAVARTRETVFSEFNPNTNMFKVTSGSSETLIRTTDFWTGRPLYVGSYRTFTGTGMVLPQGVMGAQTGIKGVGISAEGYGSSYTELKTIQRYSYNFFDSLGGTPSVRAGGPTVVQAFGGEARLQDGFIEFRSGSVIRAPSTRVSGPGFEFVQPQAGLYQADTFGRLSFRGAGSPTEFYFRPFPNTGLQGNLPSSGFGSTYSIVSTQVSGSIPQISVATLGTEQTVAAATKALARVSGSSIPGLIGVSQQFDASSQRSAQQQFPVVAPAIQSAQRQSFVPAEAFDSLPVLRSGQGQTVVQAFDQGQIPNLQPTTTFQFPNVSPGFNPGRPSPGPFGNDFPFAWFPGLGGFDAGNLGGGIIPTRRTRTRYTPDFTSLVFRRMGRQAFPTGEVTDPFKQRRIPRGYSFAFSEGRSFRDITSVRIPRRGMI